MGKKSRLKRKLQSLDPEAEGSCWYPARVAKRCSDLVVGLREPHPALLTVLSSAAAQFVEDVQELNVRDPDPIRTQQRLALISLGSGLDTNVWMERLEALGAAMGQVKDHSPSTYAELFRRLHLLMPHGRGYPPTTDAYVISPEMHNVIMAASMTLTPEDLFSLDPETDPPSLAGMILLPHPCGDRQASVYGAISALGWSLVPGQILPTSPRKPGIWVEGWSLREDLETRSVWPVAITASRVAGVRAPLGIPFSFDWLFGVNADTEERDVLLSCSEQAVQLQQDQVSRSAEYDPARDVDFRLSAYLFAFWRLCDQKIAHVERNDGERVRTGARAEEAPGRPLDRVRVVQLRRGEKGSPDGGEAETRYHHRWPVRMHKVNQYYPSTNTHRILWRGPYIKGPDGAPLLVGPKAQAVQ